MVLIEVRLTDALLDGKGKFSYLIFPVTWEELGFMFHLIKEHSEDRKDAVFISENGTMVDTRLIASILILEDLDEEEGGGGKKKPSPKEKKEEAKPEDSLLEN